MPETPKNDSVAWLRKGARNPDLLYAGSIMACVYEIEGLRAENAALKVRIVVDDAMVERAANAYNREILGVTNRPEIATHPPMERELRCTRAALEAVLGGNEK